MYKLSNSTPVFYYLLRSNIIRFNSFVDLYEEITDFSQYGISNIRLMLKPNLNSVVKQEIIFMVKRITDKIIIDIRENEIQMNQTISMINRKM